jgi:hypothetical protein
MNRLLDPQYSLQSNLPVKFRALQHSVHQVHTDLLVAGGPHSRTFASAGSSWRKWGGLCSLAGAASPAAGEARGRAARRYCQGRPGSIQPPPALPARCHQRLVEQVAAECCSSAKAGLVLCSKSGRQQHLQLFEETDSKSFVGCCARKACSRDASNDRVRSDGSSLYT